MLNYNINHSIFSMLTNTVEFKGFKFEYFVNDCMASNSIGKQEDWERHMTKFVQLYDSFYKIQNIIDVGANFGYHTVFFSKIAHEKVYAFEPQSQNFNLLQKNIHNNNIQNVISYPFACGDNSHMDIKMPIFNLTDKAEATINMGDITPNMLSDEHKYTITQSIRLDDISFPSKVDLIKIDVQGWEKMVLQGSLSLLQVHKPILIVEFEYFQLAKTNTTCKELFDFIRNNHYYIFYLEYEYPSDHVCVHNDSLQEFRDNFKEYISNHTTPNDINNNLEHGVSEKITVI